MKRSEMVKKLGAKIYLELASRINDLDTANKFADLILLDIEKSGMKPPRLPEDHCQALMSVYYGGYTFNQWEEDFQLDKEAVQALEKRLNRKKEKFTD